MGRNELPGAERETEIGATVFAVVMVLLGCGLLAGWGWLDSSPGQVALSRCILPMSSAVHTVPPLLTD